MSDAASSEPSESPGLLIRRWIWWYLLVAVVSGTVAGVFWVRIVKLPTFIITTELRAVPSPERDLAAWFAVDAWFSILGIVVGLVLGIWSWAWFRDTGWFVTVTAVLGALIAAVVCWRVGTWLGPESLDVRLARAEAGTRVPIAFELRSWPAFLLWPFAAITPVMLLAAFTPDTDEEDDDDAPTMSE